MGYGNGFVVECLIEAEHLKTMSADDFQKMIVEPMLARLNVGFKQDADDKVVVFRMFARGMTQNELDVIAAEAAQAEKPTDATKIN